MKGKGKVYKQFKVFRIWLNELLIIVINLNLAQIMYSSPSPPLPKGEGEGEGEGVETNYCNKLIMDYKNNFPANLYCWILFTIQLN